jgi:hypothetical protein
MLSKARLSLMRAALLLFALAAPALSGCLGNTDAAWAPPSVQATYRFESQDSKFPPFTIDTDVMESAPRRDQDDSYHAAYWQRSTAIGFGGHASATGTTRALLDRDLRLVRLDQECYVVDDDGCRPETLVRWEPRFGPSLNGYGWPQLLATHRPLAAAYDDTPYRWHVGRQRDGGRLVVTVSYAAGSSEASGLSTARYVYAGDEWLPERIESSDGWTMRRTSYTQGGPLSAIEPWPDLPLAPPTPSQAPLPIPDADRDLLGAGLSPRQAYDAILEAAPEARSIVDHGGCVAHYGVTVPSPDDPQPLVPSPMRSVSDHDVTLAADDGSLRGWQLSVTQDLLGTRQQAVSARDGTPAGDASCLAGPAARTATTPAGSVLARVQRFGQPTWWQADVAAPPLAHAERTADLGWVTYRFGAFPAADPQATGLVSATFDASQGRWVEIEGHGLGFGVDENR